MKLLISERQLKVVISESKKDKISDFTLNCLRVVAKKFDDYDNFNKWYTLHNLRGYFWHLTHNKDFYISNQIGPRDMTTMGTGYMGELGAIMVTVDLDCWDSHYNEDNITRNYAVLFDATDLNIENFTDINRGFCHEVFLRPEIAKKLKTVGVFNIVEARKMNKIMDLSLPGSENDLMQLWLKSNDK